MYMCIEMKKVFIRLPKNVVICREFGYNIVKARVVGEKDGGNRISLVGSVWTLCTRCRFPPTCWRGLQALSEVARINRGRISNAAQVDGSIHQDAREQEEQKYARFTFKKGTLSKSVKHSPYPDRAICYYSCR